MPLRIYDLLIFGYLLAAAIVLMWGVYGYYRRVQSGLPYRFTITLIVICGLLFIDALVIEPNWIAVERVNIFDDKLAQTLAGIKAVQISDLHVRKDVSFRENSLVEKVNALKPDLIFITGDILEELHELPATLSVLHQLKSRYGVFAVPGNTDYRRFKIDYLIKELNKVGVVFLRNETLSVPIGNGRVLKLAGTDDPVSRKANMRRTLEGIPMGEPVILLAHSPTVYTEAVLAGANLVLVGHTHGGQVGIPWLIKMSAYANRATFMSGKVKDGNTTMYVNRGIGTKTLPIRFMCRPEITEFVFTGDTAGPSGFRFGACLLAPG